jgi:osmotically-inducible protein OsmY
LPNINDGRFSLKRFDGNDITSPARAWKFARNNELTRKWIDMKMIREREGFCFPPRPARLAICVLAVASLQSVALPQLQAATTKRTITDAGITATVESDLHLAKGVATHGVDVSTSQGIVTMSGSVNNLLARERAVNVAKTIRGVRGVINQITVTPVSRPDEDIRKDVLSALLQDPATESYQVAVSVQNAAATLSGSVGSWAESQLAERIAMGVKGLKAVQNNLTVHYAATRADSEITADVRERLRWDVWLIGDTIGVKVNEGKVRLDGKVGSLLEQSRAWEDAWVMGVMEVNVAGLKIDPEAVHEVRRAKEFAVKTDEQIKQAVLASFRYDPRLTGTSPTVLVEDGTVFLTGKVTHLKAKAAAGNDAKNVVGVTFVENLLTVNPFANLPADADAEKALRAALSWDPLLDGEQIKAAVVNHVAYLSGTVDGHFQKVEAHDVATRIKGVKLVRNLMKVEPEFALYSYDDYYDWPFYDYYNGPRPYGFVETFGPMPLKSDTQIKHDIERAFFWSPFVHRSDITVTVDGGVAVLVGTVGSWVGYEEAYKDAAKSGAATVINKLKVKQGAWF